jgi:hypothetical protein
MRRRRYEILLPLTHNDGRPVAPEKFRQTQDELIDRFNGASLLPGTVRGFWVHEGSRYEDESLQIRVDAGTTRGDRQFFVRFKEKLKERFEQIEVYIVSYAIEIH